jgi:hypothetical protein
MKKLPSKTKIIICLCLAFIVFASYGVANAQTTVLANLVIPSSPEDTTTIDQRLATRKTTYKDQLPASANTDIAAKCVLAQSALTDVRKKDSKAAAIRLEAYQDLAKRLSYLVDNLSGQGVDAAQLLEAQNKFVASINQYLADAEVYKTAMDDAINVQCKNDPAGFKASVLEARKYRLRLATDVAGVKTNLSNLRTALSQERQILIKNPGKIQGSVGTKAP